MSSSGEIVREILEDLKPEDFKTFKFFLKHVPDPIPAGQLDQCDLTDTAEKISNRYGGDALKVTEMVIVEKMKMKGVWERHFQNTSKDSGVKEPTATMEDPPSTLETLRVDHGGQQSLKHGQNYFSPLQLDTNSMSRRLKLSNNNMTVTLVREDQPYPDHPDRFDPFCQLLCRNDLRGRCYWEVEWSGLVSIAVSYRGIRRKGDSEECVFGMNHQSWSLDCSGNGYSVCHSKIGKSISSSSSSFSSSSSSSSSPSGRVAVCVDRPAGSLSFFRVSSDSRILLHTFNTTFTQPLYAGFGLLFPGSSVSLCRL